MNETDPWLSRGIAGTVCVLAVLLAGTACWQVGHGYETDKNIHDLLYLIVGGLLSQVTTHAIQQVKDGMQNVQVPAPLIPDTTLASPADKPAAPIPDDSLLHPDTVTVPADL
jgi:hypothetical protein